MCNIFSHLWVLLDGDSSVWNALLTPFSTYQHFIESTWFKYSLSFQIFPDSLVKINHLGYITVILVLIYC